jgi:type VI secretion system protein ImpK
MPTIREHFDSSSLTSARGAAQSLVDLCAGSFELVFDIHAGKDPGHPEDLRKKVALLFQNLERQARQQGYEEQDIKATRYALCALVDETILNSRWGFRDQWADHKLQLEYFGDQLAGERFFDLLGRIRKKGYAKVDLLEVFCACLTLGFQGKYKLRGREELARATQTLVDEAISLRGGLSDLAPHWKIPEEKIERQVNTVPRWAWITGIASILTVILVYAVFRLWLDSAAVDAVRRMIL